MFPAGFFNHKRERWRFFFEIDHITTYKYANPVTFGTHRAMFLPRPSVIGRLLSWSVKTSVPSKILLGQ